MAARKTAFAILAKSFSPDDAVSSGQYVTQDSPHVIGPFFRAQYPDATPLGKTLYAFANGRFNHGEIFVRRQFVGFGAIAIIDADVVRAIQKGSVHDPFGQSRKNLKTVAMDDLVVVGEIMHRRGL